MRKILAFIALTLILTSCKSEESDLKSDLLSTQGQIVSPCDKNVLSTLTEEPDKVSSRDLGLTFEISTTDYEVTSEPGLGLASETKEYSALEIEVDIGDKANVVLWRMCENNTCFPEKGWAVEFSDIDVPPVFGGQKVTLELQACVPDGFTAKDLPNSITMLCPGSNQGVVWQCGQRESGKVTIPPIADEGLSSILLDQYKLNQANLAFACNIYRQKERVVGAGNFTQAMLDNLSIAGFMNSMFVNGMLGIEPPPPSVPSNLALAGPDGPTGGTCNLDTTSVLNSGNAYDIPGTTNLLDEMNVNATPDLFDTAEPTATDVADAGPNAEVVVAGGEPEGGSPVNAEESEEGSSGGGKSDGDIAMITIGSLLLVGGVALGGKVLFDWRPLADANKWNRTLAKMDDLAGKYIELRKAGKGADMLSKFIDSKKRLVELKKRNNLNFKKEIDPSDIIFGENGLKIKDGDDIKSLRSTYAATRYEDGKPRFSTDTTFKRRLGGGASAVLIGTGAVLTTIGSLQLSDKISPKQLTEYTGREFERLENLRYINAQAREKLR